MARYKKQKFECSNLLLAKDVIRDLIKPCKKHELRTAFEIDQVPLQQINETFHISLGDVQKVTDNPCCLTLEAPITVTCWYCEGPDNTVSEDAAILEGEGIMAAIMNPVVRYNQSCLTDIRFESFSRSPFDSDNNKIVVLTLEFTVRLDIDLSLQI